MSTNLCSVALRPARETVSMAASAAASVVKSAGFAVSNLEKSALARAFKPSNCALPPRRQPSGCRVKIMDIKSEVADLILFKKREGFILPPIVLVLEVSSTYPN